MLVKLYALPDDAALVAELRERRVEIRQAHPSEKRIIAAWVREHFTESWAAGCETALEQRPVTCYIAVKKGAPKAAPSSPYEQPPETLLGFACYDAGVKGMFGPEGVHEDYRGQGIGEALLLACLHAMAAERYAYAVVGWAGPVEFYAKTVGATIIPDSEPGIFRGRLSASPEQAAEDR